MTAAKRAINSDTDVAALRPAPPALVADTKPRPTKARAPLGVVELTLGDGQIVTVYGVVYGLEHAVQGDGYSARLFLDQYNQRIRVQDYQAAPVRPLVLSLRALADANGFDKIIVMARSDDWQEFLRFGYTLEAVLKHYHAGADAFVVSKFRSQERLASPGLMEETLLIEQITDACAAKGPRRLAEGYQVRLARPGDVPSLLALYAEIFESYPSPLKHASYLEHVFQKESIFAVCIDEAGAVVAAASAELHPEQRAAELTDCATRKEARGRGLMSHILHFLEEDLRRREYICAYTMARARSFGMNRVFYILGYVYNGRLINNCDIYGAYEDMNIWVKDLRGCSVADTAAKQPLSQ
jgi:putative beta-lysine N-acetyltransferase